MSTQLSHALERIKVLEDNLANTFAYIKEVRVETHNAALERAATLCDGYAEAGVTGAMVCAAAIRAMKVEK